MRLVIGHFPSEGLGFESVSVSGSLVPLLTPVPILHLVFSNINIPNNTMFKRILKLWEMFAWQYIFFNVMK